MQVGIFNPTRRGKALSNIVPYKKAAKCCGFCDALHRIYAKFSFFIRLAQIADDVDRFLARISVTRDERCRNGHEQAQPHHDRDLTDPHA